MVAEAASDTIADVRIVAAVTLHLSVDRRIMLTMLLLEVVRAMDKRGK